MRLDYKFTAENEIAKGRTSRENLEIIKTWNSNLQDENVPQIQDEVIVLFLIACRNDVELVQNTILKHYKYKNNAPEFFEGRDMERGDLRLGLETVYMSSIPVRTDDNMVIHLFKINDSNYHNFELLPLMKLSYMLVDITQEFNPPDGIVILIDMKGFGLKHMCKLKPGAIRKFLQYLQEGLPIRISEIHVVNAVFFFERLMNFLKFFMNSELINKIKSYQPSLQQEEFHKIIPKKCLPNEYGGDLPSSKELNTMTMYQLKNKKHFWDVEEQIRRHSCSMKCPNNI